MAKPVQKLQIGKNGVTDAFAEQVRTVLPKGQLIKINILKSACRDKKQADVMALELVDKLGKEYTYKLIGYVLTVKRYRKDMR